MGDKAMSLVAAVMSHKYDIIKIFQGANPHTPCPWCLAPLVLSLSTFGAHQWAPLSPSQKAQFIPSCTPNKGTPQKFSYAPVNNHSPPLCVGVFIWKENKQH